jgi:hypothetical protein
LDGERHCTAIFRSLQRCSIGFKSGFWLGHSRTFRDLSQRHYCVALAVCLGSLSCRKVNLHPSLTSWLIHIIWNVTYHTNWSVPDLHLLCYVYLWVQVAIFLPPVSPAELELMATQRLSITYRTWDKRLQAVVWYSNHDGSDLQVGKLVSDLEFRFGWSFKAIFPVRACSRVFHEFPVVLNILKSFRLPSYFESGTKPWNALIGQCVAKPSSHLQIVYSSKLVLFTPPPVIALIITALKIAHRCPKSAAART